MILVNKKHHPPSGDDEVWRLEGIGKDGAYHKNLSSCGIKTVGDFLKTYNEIGHASLKKVSLDKNFKILLITSTLQFKNKIIGSF